MIELYHFWSSVCSVKCRMALEEKGVQWTSRYIDLFKFDQMSPAYLKINPDGVVPTLVHDGQPVRESSAINEYIDAAFDGPRLVPADPLKAARMREFVKACDDGLDAIAKLTMVKYILPKLRNRHGDEVLREWAQKRPTRYYRDLHSRGIRGEITEQELGEAMATVGELLDRVDRTLQESGGPWLLGELSLADIAVAPYMFRLTALGQDRFWSKALRPAVNEWYQRLSARSAFQTAVNWPDESGGGYEEVGLTAKRDAA